MLNFIRTLLVPVLVIGLTGCPGELSPTGSGGSGGGGGGGGGGPVACAGSGGSGGASTLATWANVRDVIESTCYGSDCHREGEREPMMIASDPSKPITDAALYKKLTTYVTTKCGKRVLVKPCAPDQSSFFLAQAGMCGADLSRMPFGCEPQFDNCTPPDKLEGIRQWIANGAPGP